MGQHKAERDKDERGRRKPASPSPKRNAILITIVVAALTALVFAGRAVWHNMLPPEPPRLTAAQGQAIASALAEKGFGAPAKLEFEEKTLIATFMLDEPQNPAYLKAYALDRMDTIRNALRPHSPPKSYRVNINGNTSDPEMQIRWGHAIYAEGDTVSWTPGS